jgi:FMN phosphatase YigB (HAD superfamily)
MLPLRMPRKGLRHMRALAAYRAAQENLRTRPDAAALASTQLAAAARAVALESGEVQRVVEEWMFERPLKYLRFCRSAGLLGLLSFLAQRQVRIGALSDYPAHAKLEALGIANRFSIVLSAFDRGIDAFKPSPRGFECAARAWGLSAREVLVVGDRLDADAGGAAAAGMDCVVVGSRPVAGTANCLFLESIERLHRVLIDCR